MKILLTGATGFVGKYLLKELLDASLPVILLLRDKEKIQSLLKGRSASVTTILLSDSGWKERIKEENPGIVIHLAAYLTSADDNDSINKLVESNILFGTHLLDALKETSARYFINTGTFAEYSGKDNALSPSYLYAATKTAFRSIVE